MTDYIKLITPPYPEDYDESLTVKDLLSDLKYDSINAGDSGERYLALSTLLKYQHLNEKN